MNLNMEGKTVIVTGGSTGLGAGICEIFAEEGANVVINYIVGEEYALEFAKKLEDNYKIKATAIYADISKTDDIDNMYEKVIENFGKIDILVNNAGIWPTSMIEDMSDEEWEKVININLNGPFYLSKRLIKYFMKNDIKGHIVNITSKSAYAVNTPGHAHYVASKGGMSLFTRALAREVSKEGIIVNAVIPGIVRTPINEEKLQNPETLAKYEERIPVGKISTPKDVAYTIVYLASDKAIYTAGSCVDVTGGMLV